jgi:O-methyltransferase domain/Dimerisation domain
MAKSADSPCQGPLIVCVLSISLDRCYGVIGVSLQNTKPTPQEQIFSIVLGFWQARALAVATELGLSDLLAEGPLHIDELARRTKTNTTALFRLLRALESTGIFTQTAPRVFGNTPTSECLRKDVPGSQWPLVLQNLSKGNGPFEAWEELEYSVRTEMPSLDKIYGHDYWELLRRNPQANAVNNGAMRSASVAMTPAVTAAYEWSQFAVIADIGGGIGTQLVSILDASPSSRGILFDQPHLGPESISHNRLPGVDHQAAMSKVRRDPIARRHCSRGFPLTSFTFSCRDGSHACFTYNQRLERSEAIERLERFERPQICHLLPRAYSITY